MPQLSLLEINPLTFPGTLSGFDPAHPAARGISNGFGFSAICLPAGNFINVLNGTPFTKVSTNFPTASTVAPLGSCGLVDATTKVVQLPSQSTATPNGITAAAIARFTGTGDGSYCSVIGINSTQAAQFGMKGTARNLHMFGSPELDSTFTIALNVPYFIAGSTKGGTDGQSAFVAANLSTGQILKSSGAVGQVMNAGSAAPRIGADIGGSHYANAYIAAAMFAPSFTSVTVLAAWAADPWAFWYPRSVLYSLDWLPGPPPGASYAMLVGRVH